MADEVQQAIQMIQLTGQTIGATFRITTVSIKAITEMLIGLGELLRSGKRRFISNGRNFRDFNQYASQHGIQLMDYTIPERDVRALKRELTRNGVDFSIYTDHNGAYRVFVKASNEATLRVALEKVVASHAQTQAQTQQSVPAAQSAPTTSSEPVPFFNVSFDEALGNPDIGMHRMIDSIKATHECAESLGEGLEKAHGTGNLQQYLETMVQEYGPERVQAVLCRTVQFKENDGRISPENKQYATTHPVRYASTDRQSDMTRDLNLNVHPGIINLAMDSFRSMEHTRQASVHQLEPQQSEPVSKQAKAQAQRVSDQPDAAEALVVSGPTSESTLFVGATLFDGSADSFESPLANFDDLLADATERARAANAQRLGPVGERAAETARSIPSKTPRLER